MPSQSDARAVLTAAGSGSRLGCECPKALVELSGRPLVWWAARGLRAGGVGAIVVTAPASSIEDFQRALSDIDDLAVVAGSDRSRQESVALGLAALGSCEADAVVASPCRIAHWTGAAPRHLGRSEKCRFTHPWAGITSTFGGTRPPYATTTPRSACTSSMRCTISGVFNVVVSNSSTPNSAATSATGDG